MSGDDTSFTIAEFNRKADHWAMIVPNPNHTWTAQTLRGVISHYDIDPDQMLCPDGTTIDRIDLEDTPIPFEESYNNWRKQIKMQTLLLPSLPDFPPTIPQQFKSLFTNAPDSALAGQVLTSLGVPVNGQPITTAWIVRQLLAVQPIVHVTPSPRAVNINRNETITTALDYRVRISGRCSYSFIRRYIGNIDIPINVIESGQDEVDLWIEQNVTDFIDGSDRQCEYSEYSEDDENETERMEYDFDELEDQIN